MVPVWGMRGAISQVQLEFATYREEFEPSEMVPDAELRCLHDDPHPEHLNVMGGLICKDVSKCESLQ